MEGIKVSRRIHSLKTEEDLERLHQWLFEQLTHFLQRRETIVEDVVDICQLLQQDNAVKCIPSKLQLKLQQLTSLYTIEEDILPFVQSDLVAVEKWCNEELNVSVEEQSAVVDLEVYVDSYVQAVLENDPEEQFFLGQFEEENDNISRAIEWYERASNSEYSSAQYALGLLYIARKEYERAKTFFLLADENGEYKARLELKWLIQQKFVSVDDELMALFETEYDDLAFLNELRIHGLITSRRNQLSSSESWETLTTNTPVEALDWMKQIVQAIKEGELEQVTGISQLSTPLLYARQIECLEHVVEETMYLVVDDFLRLLEECHEGVDSQKWTSEQLEQANQLYKKAIEQNDLDMHFALGEYYRLTIKRDAFKWYYHAAQHEHVEAMFLVGMSYYYGIDVEQNYSKAFKWIKKAAKQKHIDASYYVGDMYLSGYGTNVHYDKALKWLVRAATKGQSDAERTLGMMYEYGRGVSVDERKAKKWYKKAAKSGDALAQYAIAELYYYGSGITQDYEKAYKWYERAAGQGHAEAQFSLGFLLKNGLGVEVHHKKALQWYRHAAMQGSNNARIDIADMYENGLGVEQSGKEAVKWYKLAAEDGDARAQFSLGYAYYSGLAGYFDYEQAMAWYRKSARQGNIYAQFNIGKLYEEGKGVELNYEKAFQWYMVVADQGDSDGQVNIGYFYDKGYGVEQDYDLARKWYLLAAKQENAVAQLNMGCLYEHGYGVQQDYEEAARWYRLASHQGDEDAQSYLRNLYTSGLIKLPED